MKLLPFADRDLTQVFVTDSSIVKEKDGTLSVTGKVEIVVRGHDGTASGPTVTMGLNMPVDATTTVLDIPKLLLTRAAELIERVAKETPETLIAAEALPFDDKWQSSDQED